MAEEKNRREIIKTAGQVAVTAPAVALLLNASTKPAQAIVVYGGGGGGADGGLDSGDSGGTDHT